MNWMRELERYKGLFVVLLFLLALMSIAQLSGLRDNLSLAFLRQTLSDHRWGGLLAFVLLFCLGNLAQIPGWIFLASAVLVLGQGVGGWVTYISAVTSCAVTFLTVGFMGGAALRQFDNKVVNRLLDQLQAHPVRNIVMLRTIFQSLPALNYSLALCWVCHCRLRSIACCLITSRLLFGPLATTELAGSLRGCVERSTVTKTRLQQQCGAHVCRCKR